MVDSDFIRLYRSRVYDCCILLRNVMFSASGYKRMPRDYEIAELLGISDTAYSSIIRKTASASGVVLFRLFVELSKRLSLDEFVSCFTAFFSYGKFDS